MVTDINHNSRNVSVWAAKADKAALNAAEMTALETHFAADGNHLAGTTISVHGWTEIAYTVTLVVYHNPLQSDAAAVMERVMNLRQRLPRRGAEAGRVDLPALESARLRPWSRAC